MTRDEFANEFARSMRFVLQKHEREMRARSRVLTEDGPSAKALEHANAMTDAAIQQFADHVFDAIEQTTHTLEARV